MWWREQECASCEGSKLHSLSLVSRLRFPPYSDTLKTEACLLIILLSPSSVLDGLGWGWGLVILSLPYQLPYATTTATATKTSLKKRTRATSNFVAFIPSRSIRQIMATFFYSWFRKDCIEVQGKRNKIVVLCTRPLQNVKIRGGFTLSACNDSKEMYKNAHVQSCCFANLNLLLFCRSRFLFPLFLCRRRFLSFVMKDYRQPTTQQSISKVQADCEKLVVLRR